MSFKLFFENDIARANNAPASGEVIRTGLQPQVGANEIRTQQKDGHDKIMAIDGHVERIKQVAASIDEKQTPQLEDVKAFCKKLVADWDGLKAGEKPKPEDKDGLGSFQPNFRQINFMKDNQPLPEAPRAAGPGTFGAM